MKNIITLAILAGTVAMQSCKKEDPVIPNEEELITTINYTLISNDFQDTVVLRFQDIDGPGGNDPIIIGGDLKTSKTYNGEIELLNEIESPPENISDEVENESNDHQFFYIRSSPDLGTINYKDQDMNGMPLGLKTEWITQGVSTGTLTIILRHQPDKNNSGVSDGDPTNAGGETDIEVTFDVTVQ